MIPARGAQPSMSSPTARALCILEVVAVEGVGVTAKEISIALRLPPATTYRLINQLVADEFLARTPDLRGFALGARLEKLIGAAALPPVTTAGRHHLEQLRASVRFGVHVVRYNSRSLRVLDADPDHPMVAERDLIRHLHASAAGKLLLSHLDSWQAALPAPLHKVTPATVTNLAVLSDELAAARQRDYAFQVDQLEEGMACVAFPIRDGGGELCAALCVAGPSLRVDALLGTEDLARQYAQRLAPLLC